MNDPVYFTFGLHAHQPVGNFGHVFQEHLEAVYEPFLRKAVEGDLFPLTLHLSGPLLDWLEAHGPGYLDAVGRLVTDGKVELLLAGYYEPILPALLKEDRVQQIRWMQEALMARFGTRAQGLWLTERVWEPDLAEDLAEAGVGYVLVDDRHFVASGFSRDHLHQPFRTEFGGKSLGVFAIDESLRYFLPFRPPEDTVAYLRTLSTAGHRLAVAADDIEKFGGWPGTREWVYERGWIDRFVQAMKEMESRGEVRLATFSQALADLPSGGLAYLPSSSYREMEEWTLPPEAFRRLEELKEDVGEERFSRGDSPLIRGSHWRNFLVKYPESNRMHKKSLALSNLCRDRGDPPEARRAIGAAQCNDAYWHGVFGGLYLRHLRDTVWRKLAEAEAHLRKGEDLVHEEVDLDLDGNDEIWVHSEHFSALVSPARGGAVEELTLFQQGINLANTLTRRREAYHELPGQEDENGSRVRGEVQENDGSSAPSIHDMEGELRFTEPPPVDSDPRALFVDRILPAETHIESFQDGTVHPLNSWARSPLSVVGVVEGEGWEDGPEGEGSDPGEADRPSSRWIEITLKDPSPGHLEKRIRITSEGVVEVLYNWDSGAFPDGSMFCTEVSLGAEAEVAVTPETELWRFPISTFSKSEKGYDETVQGEAVCVRWPVETGWGRVRITGKTTR